MGSPPRAPKLKALTRNPNVALTIDDNGWPHKVLLVRGTASVSTVQGIVPEYGLAARRYFGEEQGKAWTDQMGRMVTEMGRVAIKPEWVGLLDFVERFPSALT